MWWTKVVREDEERLLESILKAGDKERTVAMKKHTAEFSKAEKRKAALAESKQSVEDAKKWIEIVKQYSEPTELKVVSYPHIVIVNAPQTMNNKPMAAFLLSFS